MGGEDDHDQEDQPALVVEEVADEPAEVQHGWVCAGGRGGSGRRGDTVSTTGTPEAGPRAVHWSRQCGHYSAVSSRFYRARTDSRSGIDISLQMPSLCCIDTTPGAIPALGHPSGIHPSMVH